MARLNGKSKNWVPQADDGVERPCDWAGCDDEGLYRAPRSRETLGEYHWFCLDHVRHYNTQWNYFEGMSEEEVEAQIRRDTVWGRPTWPLGTDPRTYAFDPAHVRDDFGFFNESKAGPEPQHARSPEEKAMIVLDLRPPIDRNTVKARYKALVKLHHPDANGGDKIAEEKFKEINDAYNTIMESFGS